MTQLTKHGRFTVSAALKAARLSLKKAQLKVKEAKAEVEKMEAITHCKHKLEMVGGMELVVTTCSKCGFKWYD